MRVRDVTTRPVYTVRPADTVERAVALLADRRITAAPALGADERPDLRGRVVGPDPRDRRPPASAVGRGAAGGGSNGPSAGPPTGLASG